MSININLIKELRSKTNSSISLCKEALTHNDNNIVDAIVWLRKKGQKLASKKSSRPTNEGVIAVSVNNNKATIIELNCETDFVSKNEVFIELSNSIAQKLHTLEQSDIEKSLIPNTNNSTTINNLISDHIAILGENITLKRVNRMQVTNGIIIHYLHNKSSPNVGKIGVLISFEGDINNEIKKFGKELAMHIAASRPIALSIASIDKDIVNRERNILRSQVLEQKKSPVIFEKIVEGKMKKFFEESILLEQKFVIGGKTKVRDIIKNLQLKHNCDFRISKYIRYEVGM